LESYFASFLEAYLEKIGSIFGAVLEHISWADLELISWADLELVFKVCKVVNYAFTPLKIVVVFFEKSIVVFS
jgi:hypothetical protein